jgi:hypothetical protein
MDKPWKVILAFVGVFIAGSVFGGLFTFRATNRAFAAEQAILRPKAAPVAVDQKQPSPAVTAPAATTTASQPATRPPLTPQERNAIQVMRQLNQRVNPTAEQKEKMRLIVGRMTDDLQRIERDHWQEVTRVTDRMYEDVGGVLSPEQRIQLAKMRQEMFERVRNAKEKQRLESQAKASGRTAPAAPAKGSQGP